MKRLVVVLFSDPSASAPAGLGLRPTPYLSRELEEGR